MALENFTILHGQNDPKLLTITALKFFRRLSNFSCLMEVMKCTWKEIVIAHLRTCENLGSAFQLSIQYFYI